MIEKDQHKFIDVPKYENLTIETCLDFVKGFDQVWQYFPEECEIP